MGLDIDIQTENKMYVNYAIAIVRVVDQQRIIIVLCVTLSSSKLISSISYIKFFV